MGFFDFTVKALENHFGEPYATIVFWIFVIGGVSLGIRVFFNNLINPIIKHLKKKKYIVRLWEKLKRTPEIYKKAGFCNTCRFLFSKEREPLFMRHELEGFLPDEETRRKSRKWSREKLLRKIKKIK